MNNKSATRFSWMRMRTLLSLNTLVITASALFLCLPLRGQSPDFPDPQALQTAPGHFVTPLAVPGAVQQFLNPKLPAYPDFVAGEAVRSQLSPDGKTLAILCAGQNSLVKPDGSTDTAASTQFIFLYDVSGNRKQSPELTQVIPQTNSHVGLVFSPDGGTLYAAGGRDDAVYAYGKSNTGWVLLQKVQLGHSAGIGIGVRPNASGLGISADGKTLVVANNYNDSISVIDTATRTVRYDHDLRPYFTNNESTQGGIGGTFPFAVVVKGKTAYVSSDRDREVIAVDISSSSAGKLIARIKLDGNGLGMAYDPATARPFVAEDNADRVSVIDTNRNVIVAKIDARAPAGVLAGTGNGNGNGIGQGNSKNKGNGNGLGNSPVPYTGASPALAIFGQNITPNHHALSRQFVTLDNFMDPGDGSMDGWAWSLQGRVTNTETITQQINYASVNRGLSYESEGENRNVPVNWATVAQRDAVAGGNGTAYSTATAGLPGGTPNVLTGTGNHASSDAPYGVQNGYIFNAVMNAGGTLRNYGFLVRNIGSIGTKANPVINPFAQNIVQVAPLDPSLAPFTDVYFRGYDQVYPDLWRYNEWKREFDQYIISGNLPSISLVRVSHDHMGSFGSALGNLSTPETQQGDNDLAVGLIAKAVAESPYASDTLLIITEDDCQDGPDHVDSHRATSYVVGPYVKQGVVVSTRYSQVNALRTIEDIFGTEHMNLNTAFQRPMADVFDVNSPGRWDFVAVAPTALAATGILQTVNVPGLQLALGPVVKPTHDAAYWDKVTAGFDFSDADRVPPDKFNRVVWKGITGNKPYPALKGVRDADDNDEREAISKK